MKLENKAVVVTGASSGMGKGIVEAFAREGANVVAIAIRKEKITRFPLSKMPSARTIACTEGFAVSSILISSGVMGCMEPCPLREKLIKKNAQFLSLFFSKDIKHAIIVLPMHAHLLALMLSDCACL